MMSWGPERFDKVYGSLGLGVPVNLISRRSKALKRRVERITKRRERREAKKFEEQQELAWLDSQPEDDFADWYYNYDNPIDSDWEVDQNGRYHHSPPHNYYDFDYDGERYDDDRDLYDYRDYEDMYGPKDHGRRDCRVCDVQNEHDARFCKNCGVQLT